MHTYWSTNNTRKLIVKIVKIEQQYPSYDLVLCVVFPNINIRKKNCIKARGFLTTVHESTKASIKISIKN